MKIVVFGATGKTGELAWRHAKDEGHEVTIVGRSVMQKYPEENVKKIKGDVLDKNSIAQAIKGQDAVIICLGPVGLKDNDTLTQGCVNIIDVMQECEVERAVFISAAGVGESWRQIPWYSKLLFSTMLKNILEQHKKQEIIFEKSKTKWTAVRAAVLTKKNERKGVVASNQGKTKTINRVDLAEFLVKCSSNNEFIHTAITVASK